MARTKQLNRIPVFLKGSILPCAPAHWCSRALAEKLVTLLFARSLNTTPKSIQLTTNESWTLTKDRFRGSKIVLPQIAPPLAWYPPFMTSYPPTPYESNGRQKQADLWMQAERF